MTMNEPTRAQKIARMHRDALLSQSAINLGAIVRTFARHIADIQQQARDEEHGTEWINTHPVCVLFVEQLYFLTGSSKHYAHASLECERKQVLYADVAPLLLGSRTITSGEHSAVRIDSDNRSTFALLTKPGNPTAPDADDTVVTVRLYRSTGSEAQDDQTAPYDHGDIPVHILLTYVQSALHLIRITEA